MAGWADLPRDILALVMRQAAQLAHGHPATAALKALTGAAHVNKHWRSVATAEIELDVLCDGNEQDIQSLCRLLTTFRLVSLEVNFKARRLLDRCEPVEDWMQRCKQWQEQLFDLLADERFKAAAGGTLQRLTGVPWQRIPGKRSSRVPPLFLLRPFPALRHLQLFQVGRTSVCISGDPWQGHSCLEHLQIQGPEVTIESLPGSLRRLEVKGDHVTVDMQALTCCPEVELAASTRLCLHPLHHGRHHLPDHPSWQLSDAQKAFLLAEAVQAAGGPPGGRLRATFDRLCFQEAAGLLHQLQQCWMHDTLRAAAGEVTVQVSVEVQNWPWGRTHSLRRACKVAILEIEHHPAT